MGKTKGIVLRPAGEIRPPLVEKLKGAIEERFATSVRVGMGFPLPEEALDPVRSQYNALLFLTKYEGQLASSPEQETFHLLLTHVDLYCPSLNYVFGYAMPEKGIAIVSTARFRNKLFERTIKTAVHELGHLFKLSHCNDRECVMHFSFDLFDTDQKTDRLCRDCEKRFLKEAV